MTNEETATNNEETTNAAAGEEETKTAAEYVEEIKEFYAAELAKVKKELEDERAAHLRDIRNEVMKRGGSGSAETYNPASEAAKKLNKLFKGE